MALAITTGDDFVIHKGDRVVIDTDNYYFEGHALEDVKDLEALIPMLLDDGETVNVYGWLANVIFVNGKVAY